MSKYRSHAEKILAGIIRREGIQLAYVGKSQYWIRSNGKSMNPDFINEARKKVVEVFGGMGTIHSEAEGQQRIKDFAAKGWSAIIITDEEIYRQPKETAAKIKSFVHEIGKGDKPTPAKAELAPALPSPFLNLLRSPPTEEVA